MMNGKREESGVDLSFPEGVRDPGTLVDSRRQRKAASSHKAAFIATSSPVVVLQDKSNPQR